MTRTCKYGCPVLLGEWDENARKYHEAATGELHTRERCEEAKANAGRTQGANNHNHNHNNHGNESDDRWLTEKGREQLREIKQREIGYVDHTQGQKLKLKVLTDPTPEGLAHLYNSFGESHNIRFSQYQVAGSLYTIAVWYEEIPLR